MHHHPSEFLEGTRSRLALASMARRQRGLGSRQSTPLAQRLSDAEPAGKPGPPGDMALGAGQRAGHHHRICLDDMQPLRGVPRPDLSGAQEVDYIDTGKVRFIFREFPLDPLAAAGFMLARCAARGRRQIFRDGRHAVPSAEGHGRCREPLAPLKPSPAGRPHRAGFQAALRISRCSTRSKRCEQRGDKLGVKSTPTFFINGKKRDGALSIEEIRRRSSRISRLIRVFRFWSGIPEAAASASMAARKPGNVL